MVCFLCTGLLTVLAATLIILYVKMSRKLRYFEERGIPGPKPMLVFGNVWGIWKKSIPLMEDEFLKKYGKIYGIYEGTKPVLTIADPDILRNIFVKDFNKFANRRKVGNLFGKKSSGEKFLSVVEGEEWKAIRSLVSPTFTTGKLKKMINLMLECGNTLVESFRKKQSQSIIVKDLYGNYTIDVIATCAFGTKLNSLGEENNPFVIAAKKFMTSGANEKPTVVLFFIAPKLLSFFSSFSNQFAETFSFYEKVVMSIIKERGEKPSGRGDFLDLMLEEVNRVKEEEETSEKTKYATTEVIVAQAVLFFLAGFDTTATLLTWVSYHLARNPEIQDKLYEEIQMKLKEHGKFSDKLISDLPYMEMVINETLRISPPLARIERRCGEKVTYDGITFEEDILIAIPVYAMHHCEEFYPEPEKFIPERFTPEAKAERNQYTFLPFGHGPRNCVGMRFALDETKVALAYLVNNLRFVTTSDTEIPPNLMKAFAFNMPKDLKLGVEFRE